MPIWICQCWNSYRRFLGRPIIATHPGSWRIPGAIARILDQDSWISRASAALLESASLQFGTSQNCDYVHLTVMVPMIGHLGRRENGNVFAATSESNGLFREQGAIDLRVRHRDRFAWSSA